MAIQIVSSPNSLGTLQDVARYSLAFAVGARRGR
jgi:hypothetical protein